MEKNDSPLKMVKFRIIIRVHRRRQNTKQVRMNAKMQCKKQAIVDSLYDIIVNTSNDKAERQQIKQSKFANAIGALSHNCSLRILKRYSLIHFEYDCFVLQWHLIGEPFLLLHEWKRFCIHRPLFVFLSWKFVFFHDSYCLFPPQPL